MLSLDVPHSAALARFLAAPDFRRAYQARERGPPCTLFWARSVGYSISASGSTCTASGLLMLCGAAARSDTVIHRCCAALLRRATGAPAPACRARRPIEPSLCKCAWRPAARPRRRGAPCGRGAQIACLGVTAADWRALGWAAARSLQLGVARAAWARLGDAPLLEALHRLAGQRAAGLPDALAAAGVLALQARPGPRVMRSGTLPARGPCRARAADAPKASRCRAGV